MIVSVPQSGHWAGKRTIFLRPTSVNAESEFLARWPLPWTADESGVYVVHASGLPILVRHRLVIGYATPADREWCRAYLTEANHSRGPAKLAPLDPYDWAARLSAEWKPKRYQMAGMERVYRRMTAFGSGNILADDVGLGKTIQAIGVISRLRSERVLGNKPGACVLVVTGLSLKSQWRDEIERFSKPVIPTVSVDGPRTERIARLGRPAGVYIVNYEMVRDASYKDLIAGLRPVLIVLDETKAIANPGAATTAAVLSLCERARWTLSFNATPIENHFGDIYPQVKAADKYLLGDARGFGNRYLVFGSDRAKVVGHKNAPEFRARAAGVIFRRTHADVGSEMPKVAAVVRPCRMGKDQFAAYSNACGEFVAGVPVGAVAMAKLAAVRYAAFAADVLDPKSESAKADDLEAMLDTELSGERVVVFSCYRRVIEFLARRWAARGPLVIHSGVSGKDRADIRRRFNSELGKGRLILGTAAMSRGMNLQSARVVWSLDLPWNPGAMRQRIGRVARIGQTARKVLSVHSRAETPEGGQTVDHWFDLRIFPRKKAAMIAGLGDDRVREIGSGAPDPGAVAEFLRRTAG